MKNDWNKYREYFPTRYFSLGDFDEYLRNYLTKNPQVETILDIGGGAFGSEVLKDFNKKVYLLDPFIDQAPDWMEGKVGYDHQMKFDLVVARGSINYLTPDQISQILLWIKPKGMFVANTFLTAPSNDWTEREMENINGVKMKERFRLNGNKVEHELIYPDYEIKHFFYYYSLTDYANMLKSIGYKKYGKNSAIIQVLN